MNDEEIKQIAEKTKKEKYCCKFRTGELECGDCPITYEGYPCSEDYVLPFIDGFKAAIEGMKFDVDELTIGDIKNAMKTNPYYAELSLRLISMEFTNFYTDLLKQRNN